MPRIGILGDLHLRSSRPIHRTDNYYERQFEKLCFAFDRFKKSNCDFVIQPGDFFHDYGRDPYNIAYDAIAFLVLHKIPVYLVFGQHDIKFHNTELTDIPIQILNKTRLITQLTNNPTEHRRNILMYGMNWNDKFPTSVEKSKSKFKILVMHKMVICRKKLWPGQSDYLVAHNLAQDKYDLVICGDNHNSFIYRNKVINCGSMMRMTVAQRTHRPMFVIYDTDSRKLEKYEYPIETHDLVLKQNTRKEEKLLEVESQEVFASSLNDKEFEGQLDFRQNIEKVIKKKRCRRRTIEIIEEALSQ